MEIKENADNVIKLEYLKTTILIVNNLYESQFYNFVMCQGQNYTQRSWIKLQTHFTLNYTG